jgi:hypothetical protein
MNITVLEELRIYIDPLTPEEHQALERSILAEGCRDALVLWGEILVDGHNRYGICQKHGLPFQTVQNTRFKSMEDVHLWMIDQHLGRRSVSDFQRGVLALRKKEIVAARRAQYLAEGAGQAVGGDDQAPAAATPDPAASALPAPEPLNTREAIAKAARISSQTVVQIEKIRKSAAPELVEAVKQGQISINAAAAVASLPSEEQVAAVAGGKKELREAAKRVREAKTGSRPPATESSESTESGAEVAASAPAAPASLLEAQVAVLQERVAELTAENEQLKWQLAQLTSSGSSASLD